MSPQDTSPHRIAIAVSFHAVEQLLLSYNTSSSSGKTLLLLMQFEAGKIVNINRSNQNRVVFGLSVQSLCVNLQLGTPVAKLLFSLQVGEAVLGSVQRVVIFL